MVQGLLGETGEVCGCFAREQREVSTRELVIGGTASLSAAALDLAA